MTSSREIRRIVIHCSATPPSMDIGAAEIDRWHRDRGWAMIGYNAVIRRDGRYEQGRAEKEILAHASGYNRNSLAVCWVGGLTEEGDPAHNMTPMQENSLRKVIEFWALKYPGAEIMGHRDLPGVAKDCPCFDVRHWLATGTLIDPRKVRP